MHTDSITHSKIKISIAASIRLLFILTLVAISVAAPTGLIEGRAGLASARAALDRGDSDTAVEILEKVVACNSGEHTEMHGLPEM